MERKPFRKQDFETAIAFAVTGMNVHWYLKSPFMQRLYGRYFLYAEAERATEVIAVYEGERLAGLLLAEIYGEKRYFGRSLRTLFVRFVEGMQKLFFQSNAGLYDAATAEMLAAYRQSCRPDGEVLFLAADPALQGTGVGSLLLAELERRTRGKTLFLYTDSACTYSFYERCGFCCMQERTISLDTTEGTLALRCMLYSKTIPDGEPKTE